MRLLNIVISYHNENIDEISTTHFGVLDSKYEQIMIEHKNTQWFYNKRRSYHNFRICSITYKNLWLIYWQLMEIIKMESFLPLPLEY